MGETVAEPERPHFGGTAAEGSPMRVLLIDDDEDDFLLTRDMLAGTVDPRFELDWAGTYEEGLAAISRREHDAYLVDYRLGVQDGLELLREARARGCTQPIIILTGQGGHEVDVEAMVWGAADYLVKNEVDPDRLERSLRYSIERAETQKRLENLVRSRDELIASVSHELRTPLAAVVGFAQLLQQGSSAFSAEERAEIIQTIVDEGMDLANIVEDLLVAAKAEARTLVVVSVSVDLRAQAAQVLETVDQRTQQHIEVAGPSVRATGDPGRVRQIVRNLVSNALMYGGPTIRVSISSDDTTARLTVSDDGPAISPQKRKHIFEQFQRAHDTPGLTRSLGLGLAISRELARLMAGDVTYRHEAGESIFELALPKAD